MSYTLTFPTGVNQYIGPDGTLYTPDGSNQVTVTDSRLAGFMAASGFGWAAPLQVVQAAEAEAALYSGAPITDPPENVSLGEFSA